MMEIQGLHNKAIAFAGILDNGAITQVENLCNQEFTCESKIRLMPDAHAGKGCVVGTTMTIKNKIVPNLVGVDIACGVEAVNIGNESFDPARLDQVIRERVPSGFKIRKQKHELANDIDLSLLFSKESIALGKAARAIGTLGGGNHFIEVDIDQNGSYWLVVHTGSRNPGLQTANYHQKIAIANHPEAPAHLAWLEDKAFEEYISDLSLIQKYANLNRRVITEEIMTGMGWSERDRFTTMHNYLDLDHMILRKGAVSAQKGERLIIPVNMRDGSLVCEGLGNEDWNYSAPHGAGRLMSRGEAMRNLSLEEYTRQMEGVYTTSINNNTLDEAPDAYKPLANIISEITETAKIINRLKPVYNYKDSTSGIGKRRH